MPDDSLARVFAIITASTASIHDDGYTWACDVSKQGLPHYGEPLPLNRLWLPCAYLGEQE